jgi:hypothetical protein
MDHFISVLNTSILSSNVTTPFIVYIGVGTAAGTFTMDENTKIVTADNYHQYPQVLRDMDNTLREHAKKYILLIDPYMENPPHITIDKSNGFNFVKQSENIYADFKNHIYLHIIREHVTHNAYDSIGYNVEGQCYITDKLTTLIDICKTNCVNLIYHDFSGRPLLPIYKYHSEQIDNDSDLIIIGLGAQGDFGCYFDLTSPIATFAMKLTCHTLNHRRYLSICSPRYYFDHELSIYHAIDNYPDSNLDVLIEQFKRICQDKYDELNSKVFYKLRFLKQLQKKSSKELDEIKVEDIKMMFGDTFGICIFQRINERNLELAFIESINYFGPEYTALCIHHDLHSKYNIRTGDELLYTIISNSKDEYSWGTELRKYIEY